jgi:two-component system CheB/CheR fusion protein
LDFIHKANEQVDKLTTLVENLLDVTKIQAGKMAFNKSEFDMSELIDECVYHIQNLSRNLIHIDRNEAVYVFADQNRIEQVIMNLLSNAVKYSPDSTEIVLNSYEQDGVLKVEIKDQGIGIAEENLPYVFDRFFRGINSSEKFSGLGLGLYISADIIRRHGGKVGVDSSLGNGSTFWFTIPLLRSTEKNNILNDNNDGK